MKPAARLPRVEPLRYLIYKASLLIKLFSQYFPQYFNYFTISTKSHIVSVLCILKNVCTCISLDWLDPLKSCSYHSPVHAGSPPICKNGHMATWSSFRGERRSQIQSHLVKVVEDKHIWKNAIFFFLFDKHLLSWTRSSYWIRFTSSSKLITKELCLRMCLYPYCFYNLTSSLHLQFWVLPRRLIALFSV